MIMDQLKEEGKRLWTRKVREDRDYGPGKGGREEIMEETREEIKEEQ